VKVFKIVQSLRDFVNKNFNNLVSFFRGNGSIQQRPQVAPGEGARLQGL